VEEWAPDALRHALRRRPRPRAGPFAGVDIITVDVGASRVAVVHDRPRRTYTAVLGAAAPGFVLLGEDDKAGRVQAWSGVLASLARDGSAVHRVQWVERARPADGGRSDVPVPATAVPGAAHANGSGANGSGAVAAARTSYDALLAAESHAWCRHEVLLAVTVHAGRAARAVKAAGGGPAGACTVLLRETAALRRRLADASVEVGAVLGPRQLAAALRAAFDGTAGPDVGGLRIPAPAADATDAGGPADWTAVARSEGWPWPMGTEATWGHVRTDATVHATFWVSEWPRVDVGPDFLGPLVLLSDVRRTVSVVMEPLGPLAAARRVEQARTADIADAELRRRGGFLATARRRREEEILARRETELADGHAQYRFAGYVTVSAADPDALEEACGRVEQAAGRAGLELRRCFGDQAQAFTCTLPMGRGLP